MVAPVIVAAGIGAAASYLGSRSQNSANANLNVVNRNFNANEAVKNRGFQQMMSSTSHQRGIRDLKAAGLNPILSATNGASSPGGSQATAAGASNPMVDEAEKSINSALNIKLQQAQIEKLTADTDKVKSTTPSAAGLKGHLDQLKENFPEIYDKIDAERFYKPEGVTSSGKEISDDENAEIDRKIKAKKLYNGQETKIIDGKLKFKNPLKSRYPSHFWRK